MSFTPNTQHIANAVEAEFGSRVRVGAWACRRIAGTLTWSQHSYTQENYLDRDYLGNAADIFPTSMAVGDQVQAFLWREFPGVVKVVLWRVKNHFDHVHFDPWPTGINLPPCRGGILQVRHRDGRIGREFTNAFDNEPVPVPPAPAPIPPTPAPVPPVLLGVDMIPTKQSSEDDIRFFQELLNDTYGSTLKLNGQWGDGMDGIIQKLLVPLTNDTDPAVKAGEKVNARQWKTLTRDWVLKIVADA